MNEELEEMFKKEGQIWFAYEYDLEDAHFKFKMGLEEVSEPIREKLLGKMSYLSEKMQEMILELVA